MKTEEFMEFLPEPQRKHIKCPFCKLIISKPQEECPECGARFFYAMNFHQETEKGEIIVSDSSTFEDLMGYAYIQDNSVVRELLLSKMEEQYGESLAEKALKAIMLGLPYELITPNFKYAGCYYNYPVYAVKGEEVEVFPPAVFLTYDTLVMRLADVEDTEILGSSPRMVLLRMEVDGEEVILLYMKEREEVFMRLPFMLNRFKNVKGYTEKENRNLDTKGEFLCETAARQLNLEIRTIELDFGTGDYGIAQEFECIKLNKEKILEKGLKNVLKELLDNFELEIRRIAKL